MGSGGKGSGFGVQGSGGKAPKGRQGGPSGMLEGGELGGGGAGNSHLTQETRGTQKERKRFFCFSWNLEPCGEGRGQRSEVRESRTAEQPHGRTRTNTDGGRLKVKG